MLVSLDHVPSVLFKDRQPEVATSKSGKTPSIWASMMRLLLCVVAGHTFDFVFRTQDHTHALVQLRRLDFQDAL